MAQTAGAPTKGDNGAARTEDLQADLAALRKDFGILADHVRSMADGTARDAAHGLAERGAKLRDAAKQRGEAGIAAFESQVQAHPFTSILVAFGVGLVVSRLVGRDR